MESSPILNRIMWYVIMLAVPLLIYGIVWLIYLVKNYYAEYIYYREGNRASKGRLDTRMPILYLRNFRVDGSRIETLEANVPDVKFKLNLPTLGTRDIHLNRENFLRRKVSPIGPLISIGDDNSADIGIVRIKSSDAQWKKEIEAYMIVSSMIILRTSSGITPGITWELNMILDRFLYKTLFFIESDRSGLKRDLDEKLKLKFPNNKQKELTDRVVPYYLWIAEDGTKKYPLWLRHSIFFKRALKDSKANKMQRRILQRRDF